MSTGWFKVERALFDHQLSRDPIVLALWVRLIGLANFEPSQVRWGKSLITLQRGQILITLRKTAEESGLTVKQIRRALQVLEEGTHLGTLQGTLGTIVTIYNYEHYQDTRKNKGTLQGTLQGTPRAHLKKLETDQRLEPHGVDPSIRLYAEIKEEKEFYKKAPADADQKFSLRKEAEEAISLAIDYGASRFIDIKAVRATAKASLDRYGIEVVRIFRQMVIEGGHEGQIPFSQSRILNLMGEASKSIAEVPSGL